jgi:type II secretory pathway pseudopilin PulG
MSESKPSLKWALPGAGGLASKRGFSAIEVTAVAAIIFVLALVLVPIVNKRVDEAKRTACEEDLVAIEKAEQLAFGYTGHYFRLCDLDRPEPLPTDNPAQGAFKMPPAYWNGTLMMQTETNYLIANWKGPYLPRLHKDRSMPLAQMAAQRPELINADQLPPSISSVTPQGGPILIVTNDDLTLTGGKNACADERKYPIDPWGNPYLFFGPGLYGTPSANAVWSQIQNPVNFPGCVAYSLGPDGVAGNVASYGGQAPTPTDYYRETLKLGTGDDLQREF